MAKSKPILRWAGGKTWFTNKLNYYLPDTFNNYHEPFIGGASIFLHLKSNNFIQNEAYLSDSNVELINAYQVIKDMPELLIEELKTYLNRDNFYYQMRANAPNTNLLKAARFIYLNRTSFNGIYRENSNGDYNVPFGRRSLSELFEYDSILEFSRILQSVTLVSCDFEDSLLNINEGDLVFLDPPYTVAHENNGFIKYNKKIFSWEDQERLKNYIVEIINRGAFYILTNAAHISIENLYTNIGARETLSRSSTIGGKGAKREKYNEYVFFNTI